MTEVVYGGPYEEVELPVSASQTLVVKKGETVDVPTEIAENLKDQGTWHAPKSSQKKKED